MPTEKVNGVEIAYELHGSETDPVLLLVQGLGMPLTAWPAEFIDLLIGRGFRVLTFDNRDIGKSSLQSSAGVPNIVWQMVKAKLGFTISAPYQLDDMARDAEELLDALALDRVHVVGVSMGGMISQLLALQAQRQVISLTSIMSTSGNRRLPGPTRAVARQIMFRPDSTSSADRLAYGVKTWRMIGSPAYPRSDAELETLIQRNYERGVSPEGIARQLLAIGAAPSRVERLRQLDIPSLIIHGRADPLIPVACGIDTADSLPNARLKVIEGMGHDLPPQLLGQFADWIVEHARSASMKGSRAN